jgi:hypothetical protein
MMRPVRAAVIATFSVLISAATAYAGCAWDVRESVVVDHPVWDSIGGVDLP